MKDLTKGKPSRLILAFALPIFLANLLQLTYSLVDTRIVGTFLGEDALAAVGATSSLSNLIIGFLMGLSNGFAIITAQRFGAKDLRGVKKSFAMSLTLGTAVAAGLTVLGLLFLQPILRFLNVPENLRTMAGSYIVIIIAGLIATFLYDACAAALRALGDTITPLVILAISVILNIAGDLFFVVVLKTGVRGAAVATVSAQALAFVICWIYMLRRYEMLRLVREDFRDADTAMMKNMLGSGLSMGFMSSLVNIGSLTLQTAINKLGQDIIVAHTAARKISEIFMTMFSVFGQTMATYGGQNYGCGDVKRIKAGVKAALLAEFVYSVAVALLMCALLRPCLGLFFTGDVDISAMMPWAETYCYMTAMFFLPLCTIFIFRNIMQGCGYGFLPMMGGVSELIARLIVSMAAMKLLSYPLACFADPAAWIAAAVFTGVSYLFVIKKIGRELKEKTT